MTLQEIINKLKQWTPEQGVLPLRDLALEIRNQDIIPKDIELAIQSLDADEEEEAINLVQKAIKDLEDIQFTRQQKILPEKHRYGEFISLFIRKYLK